MKIWEMQPKGDVVGKKPNRKVKLIVYAPTPSANKWTFAHWTKYRRHKQDWLMRLAIAVKSPMLGIKRAEITIDRFARRRLDADNAVAGCKPIIDALVKLGVLPDDHLKVMPAPPTVNQYQVKKGIVERSIIYINEIEERDLKHANDKEKFAEGKTAASNY